MARYRHRREPGVGTFLALGAITIALNIAIILGLIALIVVLLRALGVIH
jgi:hypothetical protein